MKKPIYAERNDHDGKEANFGSREEWSHTKSYPKSRAHRASPQGVPPHMDEVRLLAVYFRSLVAFLDKLSFAGQDFRLGDQQGN